jgi:hypothetical protein
MRRLLAAFGLAAILAVPSAAIGLAAAPDHESFKVDETFPENLCGLDVTTHVVGTGNVLMFEDHFVDLSVLHVTWTNIDGDWLTLFFAGPAALPRRSMATSSPWLERIGVCTRWCARLMA